jgi:hypothetical protein
MSENAMMVRISVIAAAFLKQETLEPRGVRGLNAYVKYLVLSITLS